MDPIEGSETSANINQTLGIHPKIETVNVYTLYSTFSYCSVGKGNFSLRGNVLCDTKLNTQLHVMSSSRMSGFTPPRFYKYSCRTQE
jgi:hypothetical protein